MQCSTQTTLSTVEAERSIQPGHISDYLLPLLLCWTCGVSTARAVEGHVEIGTVVVSDDSAKFGEYTGLDEEGPKAVVNFQLRDVEDWGKWEATGENLGLDSRAIELQFTQPGQRSLRFSYRELPHNRSTDGRVPFSGVGSNTLLLPSGWVAGANTAGMSGLTAALAGYEDASKRKRFDIDYSWFGNGGFAGDIAYSYEVKDGIKTHNGVIGNTGGNPRAVTLPTPIDYTHEQLQMILAWSGDTRHAEFGYRLSRFRNDHDSIQWQNPYAAHSGWSAAAGYPGGFGALAQESDNFYQQLFGALSFRLSPTTSVSSDFSYALFEQDEDFLPYSVNPALVVTTPLPRNSLDGEVGLARFRLQARTRLNQRLTAAVKLTYESRDNDTPRDQFIYIGGDSQDQDTASSSRARTNLPQSYRDRKLELSGNYRLPNQRRFGVKYEIEKRNRDFAEVERSNENTLKLSFSDSSLRDKHLRVNFSREQRRASDYRGDAPYLASHSAAYVAGEPPDERFENLPQLRKFYLASRDRDQLFARAAWTPSETLSAGVNLALARDDYPDSQFGLTKASRSMAAVDVSHVPGGDLDLHLFLSREHVQSKQAGRSFRGFAVATESVDPNRNWRTETDDTVSTAGMSLDWRGLSPQAQMSLNYVYSDATGRVDTETGPALTALPLPNLEVHMQNISAQLRYALSKRNTLKIDVAHERYDSSDFRYDGISENTLSNVITGGQQSPDYSQNMVTVTFRHELP